MNKERLKKLENVSCELLSKIIFEETRDIIGDFSMINVLYTEISSDLSYIDVWVSSLNNGALLTKALAKKNYIIQWKYNRAIQIRKLPKIRYRYDESWVTSEKILQTIKEIQL